MPHRAPNPKNEAAKRQRAEIEAAFENLANTAAGAVVNGVEVAKLQMVEASAMDGSGEKGQALVVVLTGDLPRECVSDFLALMREWTQRLNEMSGRSRIGS